MNDAERRTADRLHRLSMIAEDVASRPDLGPYEVGVLQELAEEANALADAGGPRSRTHVWHDSPGRAVDILPMDPFEAARRSAGGVDIAVLVWGSS